MAFVDFIMSIIDYIKALVAYFRAKNDGKDVEPPKFPQIGGKDDDNSEAAE